MNGPGAVFLDFNLPNATTWFYFSWLLAMALFVKFSRLLSVRNWDVLSLFFLVPGLLLILEARSSARTTPWLGYLWLFGGSLYLLVRCFWDLALVRRPAIAPNLNLSGLGWLGGALFVSLVTVAVRQPNEHTEDESQQKPTLIDTVQGQGERVLQQAPRVVNSEEIRVWVERGLAIFCHLAIVIGLVIVGWRHFQDTHIGVAAATCYLLLPYVYLLLPHTALNIGQWHHALPGALLVWAIAAYRMPTISGLLLGLATGTVYFPVLLLPLWLSFYRGRGVGRFLGAFFVTAGVCLGGISLLLWWSGSLPESWRAIMSLADWQPWMEPRTEGFWTSMAWAWAYRLPVFVAFVVMVGATLFWPKPKNLAHLLALTVAVLVGVQFWYANQGGAYVLWYLPLLLLLAFRPNLSDRQPLPIVAETDWLARLSRRVRRAGLWLLHLPEPAARV